MERVKLARWALGGLLALALAWGKSELKRIESKLDSAIGLAAPADAAGCHCGKVKP